MSDILREDEARAVIKAGIDKSVDIVSVTAGPFGRNVVISQGFGASDITNDGATIVRAISLEDPVEDIGAHQVKEVATLTEDACGDGPQPYYAKVLTPKGFVDMGALKIDDKICGTNKSIQTVLGVYDKGEKTVYEVELSDGRVVECSGNHLWEVTSISTGKPTIKTAKELLSGIKKTNGGNNRYKYYIPNTEVEFEEQSVLVDPYLIGLLLGDGALSSISSVRMTLGKRNEFALDKATLPPGVTYTKKWISEKNCFDIRFQGRLHKILDKYNLMGTNSGTKFIPSEYLNNSTKNRTALLSGLLTTTDGYINGRGMFEYSTISNQLKNDFIYLTRSLGYQIRWELLEIESGKSYSDTPIYRIGQRKGFKYGEKIVSITRTSRKVNMLCIKVSNEDHLYITDNFAVTHNTTTASMLFQEFTTRGLKMLAADADPNQLKVGMALAANIIVKNLDEMAIKVTNNRTIKKVATLSANNDEELGDLIARAFEKAGTSGEIAVSESNNYETRLELVEGLRFDRGIQHRVFINNMKAARADVQNPHVLVTDKRIKSSADLNPILELLKKEENSTLLVISDEVQPDVLETIAMAKMQGAIDITCVKAPGFGDSRAEMLEDIAIITGATFIGAAINIKDVVISDLGMCDNVYASRDETTIFGGQGEETLINDRIDNIREQLKDTDLEDYPKEILQKRLGYLTGGVAVLYVGAGSDTELAEKKYRIEDAIGATQSAVSEGVIPGGGLALLRATANMEVFDICETEDERLGAKIIIDGVQRPFRQILENAGLSPEIVMAKIINKSNPFWGLNVKTGKYGDLMKLGVIDPVKVTKSALLNATSVAALMLTTEAVVFTKNN